MENGESKETSIELTSDEIIRHGDWFDFHRIKFLIDNFDRSFIGNKAEVFMAVTSGEKLYRTNAAKQILALD